MEGRTGDDASLVDRLRRGDPRAFEDLVIAYQHRVFGVALRMLGNRAEAEELAQEVFLRVHRAIGAFRGEAVVRGDRGGARAGARHGEVEAPSGPDGFAREARAIPAMTCHDAREQFSALIDDALDAPERTELDAHLAACADCRRELQRFRDTVALVRAAAPVRAPAGFVGCVLGAAGRVPWQ